MEVFRYFTGKVKPCEDSTMTSHLGFPSVSFPGFTACHLIMHYGGILYLIS